MRNSGTQGGPMPHGRLTVKTVDRKKNVATIKGDCSLRQPDAAHQVLKARVGAEGINPEIGL